MLPCSVQGCPKPRVVCLPPAPSFLCHNPSFYYQMANPRFMYSNHEIARRNHAIGIEVSGFGLF